MKVLYIKKAMNSALSVTSVTMYTLRRILRVHPTEFDSFSHIPTNNTNIFRFSRSVLAWIYLVLCSKKLERLWSRREIQESKLYEEFN